MKTHLFLKLFKHKRSVFFRNYNNTVKYISMQFLRNDKSSLLNENISMLKKKNTSQNYKKKTRNLFCFRC